MTFVGLLFVTNICLKKFKWENLISPIYDSSCDNGDFSHWYIIVYEYFGL
jgi:hypothetical protein